MPNYSGAGVNRALGHIENLRERYMLRGRSVSRVTEPEILELASDVQTILRYIFVRNPGLVADTPVITEIRSTGITYSIKLRDTGYEESEGWGAISFSINANPDTVAYTLLGCRGVKNRLRTAGSIVDLFSIGQSEVERWRQLLLTPQAEAPIIDQVSELDHSDAK